MKGCRCYRCRVRDAAARDAAFRAIMAANGPWSNPDAEEFDRIVEASLSRYGVKS
jgi:hypothetical protein